MGLRICRISQTGNGLIFDKATVAQLEQLAAMYAVEDRRRKQRVSIASTLQKISKVRRLWRFLEPCVLSPG